MVVSFVALSISFWVGGGEGGILKWFPAYTTDATSSSSFATKVEASDDDDSGQ